jgi:hypothetical protein
MSKRLSKQEVEHLVAALDDSGNDDRLERLRIAAAIALARLIGRDAPWGELIELAGATAGWSPERVRRLRDDPIQHRDDAIDALYDLITELNETRTL